MKKCVLMVLIVMSLSCSLYNEIADYSYESRIQKADIYYLDEFYILDSIWDISNYLNEHIVYKADDWDEWSITEETLARGYGDCEDFAIAFMNIYYVVFNEKCDLVLVDSGRARGIGTGGFPDHAVVKLPNGELWGAKGGYTYNTPSSFSYSFDLFLTIRKINL